MNIILLRHRQKSIIEHRSDIGREAAGMIQVLIMTLQKLQRYTLGEEVANSLTHGAGIGLSIAGLVMLVVQAVRLGTVWHIVSYSIFGSMLILLYLASTLYHSFPWEKAKRICKILDHAAIYLLIAGTYTPFMLVCLRGGWGWSLFGVIWGLALLGVAMKIVFIARFKVISLVVYLAMGWLCIIAGREMLHKLPSVSLGFLLAGGLIYSIGTVFYVWKKLPYGHAVWHMFVLGGSVLHFFAVWYIL